MPDSVPTLLRSRNIFFLTGATLLCALLLGGGTRAGFLGDAILQYLSLPLLLIAGARVSGAQPGRGARAALLFCALLAFIPLLQLIPLPPALRALFPGNQWIVDAYALLDRPAPYWPLSLSPHATWTALLSLIPPVAVFFGVVSIGYEERLRLGMLVLGFCVVSVFLSLLQLGQGPQSSLRFYAYTNTDDAVGFFANRNHFSALLYACTMLAACWAVIAIAARADRPDAKALPDSKSLLYIAGALTVLAILVMAQGMARSRAGLMLSMVALLAALPLALTHRSGSSSDGSSAKIIVGVAVFAAVFSLQFVLYRILSRFGPDSIGDTRAVFARNAYEAAKAYLPFGSGAGTFVWVYPQFERPADVTYFFANRAHNDFVEAALETGLPGILMMGVFAFWLMRKAVTVWSGSSFEHASETDRTLMKSATVILALLAMHSSVDYPLHTAAMTAVAALCCGLLVSPAATHGHGHKHHHQSASHHHQHDAGGAHRHAHKPIHGQRAVPHAQPKVDARPVPPAGPAGASGPPRAARPHERWEGPSEWPQEWQAGAAKPRTGRAGDKAGGSDGDQGNS